MNRRRRNGVGDPAEVFAEEDHESLLFMRTVLFVLVSAGDETVYIDA